MEKFVLAITRTCGSGGTTIGSMLAKEYQIGLYDRQLMSLASEDSGISEALFASADESVKNTLLYKVSKKVYNGELIPPESGNFTSDNNLFNYQAKILKEMARTDSYVVIGRAADFILQDDPNMISIFLHADKEASVRHIMEEKDLTEKQAEKYRKKMDRYRSQYYKYHTGKVWRCPDNYDLCLDTEKLGYEDCVKLIMEYVAMRIK
ncbi:MAG: cytidylate kinase-like family protein [Lachnospiraceae bacterium]|nr:cytidylate kinase-like family protein [Lachnospiraceae bacterium]MDD3660483.1 cytidylate kinase-like family protein [Lachnospiraceae bacterium]